VADQVPERYVPLGYSRKFWYQDILSTEVSSITSPYGQKKLYLDPNQLELVKGKRCVLIDDAVSSGKTLKSSWNFLEGDQVRAKIEVVGVCMKQGERWKDLLDEDSREEGRSKRVKWVFESPLLKAGDEGWNVRE
jgi:adenine/guanine phosphoribosyltransferase-like PRPP-binding protein